MLTRDRISVVMHAKAWANCGNMRIPVNVALGTRSYLPATLQRFPARGFTKCVRFRQLDLSIVSVYVLVIVTAGCGARVTNSLPQTGARNVAAVNWKFGAPISDAERTWQSPTVMNDIFVRVNFRPHYFPPRDELEQELAQLEKELQTKPGDPWLLWWRAVPLAGLGRDAEAVETQRKAISAAAARSDMADTEAWFYFAEAYMSGRRGNVKCAALNFMRSIERSPRCAPRFQSIEFPNAAANEPLKFPDSGEITPERAQRWGDGESFFTRFRMPRTVRELQAKSAKVIPSISYLEVPKIIGFPNGGQPEKLAMGRTRYFWKYNVDDPISEPPPTNSRYRQFSDDTTRYRPEEFQVVIENGRVVSAKWIDAW